MDNPDEQIGNRHIELAQIAAAVYRTLETPEHVFSKQELLTALLERLLPHSEIQGNERRPTNRKTQYYRDIQEDYYRGVAQFLTIFWMRERGHWTHQETDVVFKQIARHLKSENISPLFIHWFY